MLTVEEKENPAVVLERLADKKALEEQAEAARRKTRRSDRVTGVGASES